MKTKNKSFRSPIGTFDCGYLFFAFLIPVAIMWLIFIFMETYPFGDSSVLVLDLNGQYVYFFEELRDKVLNGGSFLYTWNRSLGGEFMGIYAYYLASPFSFLMALFPENHITECLLLIMLLKVGCLGLSMAYYLHRLETGKKTNVLIFSTCYALSGYMIAYGHNTMWVDCLILLPLVSLGIEKLIKKGEFGLFVVTVAMSLLTSFYIGYMVCIYVALYFFYWYFAHNVKYENNFYMEDNHFWKSLGRIAVYSLIAIMISAIIVLPAYTSLQFGKNTFSTPSYKFQQNFDLLDFCSKFFPGSYDTVRPEGFPFIYCSTLALMLLPIYFLAPKIRAREKILGGFLLLIFLFSFDCYAVDLVWHGFQRPNWLNYRYSFMFIFLVLVMSFKALDKAKKLEFKYVIVDTMMLGLLLMVIQKQDYKYIDDIKTIWFSAACLVAYLVLIHAECRGYLGKVSSVLILVAVCVELFTSGLFDTISLDKDVVISSRVSYNSFMEKMTPLVDYVQEQDTSPFYRMEKNIHRKTNDSMALHFHGISNSTSTLNASVVKLLNQFGYASKSHWSKYLGGTPVSDAIFDLKYVISEDVMNTGVYELMTTDEDNGYYVYYNPYALSLGYAVNDDVLDVEPSEIYTPFERMNEIVTGMLGREETVRLFVPVSYEKKATNLDEGYTSGHTKYSPIETGKKAKLAFTLHAEANTEIFAYFPSNWPREVSLTIDGSASGTYFGNETNRIVSLGVFPEETDFEVVLTYKEEDFYLRNNVDFFFTLDNEVYKEAFGALGEGNWNITSFEDTDISGTVSVPAYADTFFTTIPYDEGWIVTVDGNRVETEKALYSLLSFDITPGEHEVRLVYYPDCYAKGRIISLAGIVCFGAALIIDQFVKMRRNRKFAEYNGIY
ncbi:MAG: YfhO family protein [Lachnospiraceae bacterium]|nr:YfhO family protein [Lachnospiraceae bacterium]